MVEIGGEQPSLEVRVKGGETYHVPLLYSLRPEEVSRFGELDEGSADSVRVFQEFFARYVPEEVVGALSLSDLLRLMQAWTEESKEGAGVPLGESSASPTS